MARYRKRRGRGGVSVEYQLVGVLCVSVHSIRSN